MKIHGTETGRWRMTPNYKNMEKSEWCSAHHTNRPHICGVKPQKITYIDWDFAEVERRVIAMTITRSDWIQFYDDVREYFRSQPRVKRWSGKEITEIMDTMEREFMRRKEEAHEEKSHIGKVLL